MLLAKVPVLEAILNSEGIQSHKTRRKFKQELMGIISQWNMLNIVTPALLSKRAEIYERTIYHWGIESREHIENYLHDNINDCTLNGYLKLLQVFMQNKAVDRENRPTLTPFSKTIVHRLCSEIFDNSRHQ